VTEVEFHTGVVDPVGFACRLLRKATRRGARVRVMAPDDTLDALDRALWIFDERDFIPHVRVPGASAETAARTPIWLVPSLEATAGDAPAPTVLLNLGADAPQALSGLHRLIEIVSGDVDEAARGRLRWRAYKARGLDITHHTAPAADAGSLESPAHG
jgi:DNA polymerase III subunit chi